MGGRGKVGHINRRYKNNITLFHVDSNRLYLRRPTTWAYLIDLALDPGQYKKRDSTAAAAAVVTRFFYLMRAWAGLAPEVESAIREIKVLNVIGGVSVNRILCTQVRKNRRSHCHLIKGSDVAGGFPQRERERASGDAVLLCRNYLAMTLLFCFLLNSSSRPPLSCANNGIASHTHTCGLLLYSTENIAVISDTRAGRANKKENDDKQQSAANFANKKEANVFILFGR